MPASVRAWLRILYKYNLLNDLLHRISKRQRINTTKTVRTALRKKDN